jgi:hypothetical protein
LRSVAFLIPSFRPDSFFTNLLPALQKQINDLAGQYKFKVIVLFPERINDLRIKNLDSSDLFEVLTTSESGFAIPRNLLWNAAANCEVNIFLDDDQIPTINWLSNLLANIDTNPGFAVYVGDIHYKLETNAGQFSDSPLLPKSRIGDGKELCTSKFAIPNCTFIRSLIGPLESPFSLEFNNGGEDTAFLTLIRNLGFSFFQSSNVQVIEKWEQSRVELRAIIRRNRRGRNAFYKHRLYSIDRGWKADVSSLVVYGRIFLMVFSLPILLPLVILNFLNPFSMQRIKLFCFFDKVLYVSFIPWKLKARVLIERMRFDFS